MREHRARKHGARSAGKVRPRKRPKAAAAPGMKAADLRLAEARLRASEERFRALASDAPIGLFLANPSGKYEYVNPRWCEMTGLSVEEALGDGWARGVHPDDRKPVIANWLKVASSRGEWELEHRFQTPRGTITWVFTHTAPLLGDDGKACGYIGTCIDITGRKVAEGALRDSEARYRALFDEAPVAYNSLDAGGLILDVNDPWLAMLGCAREEVIGKPFGDFLHADSTAAFREHFARLKQARALPETLFGMTRKNGEQIVVLAVTRAGHDARGEFKQAHCVLHNVTRQIQLEKQYRQAQKLEAIGHLAGGVAHDFNNLLQVIDSCAKNTMSSLAPDSAAARELRDAIQACGQAAALVDKLRAFSRRQVMRRAHLDMNEVLAQSTETLRKILGPQVRLDFRPCKGPLPLVADRGMIEQVLVNLAIHARDAMPAGGSLLIETKLVSVGQEEIPSHPCGRAGTFVRLSIADTGRGMEEEALARVFEPYTGPETDEGGSGLCLSAVHGIAEQHGGTVHATSSPGHGTTFDVYLPAHGVQPQGPEEETRGEVKGGTETILLAEDHDVVRRLAQQSLERAGYTVLAASDGAEAVALFRQNADRVKLLLLDVLMPKLLGPQVYEAAHAIRPNIPALFLSGQHETTRHTDFILNIGTALIHKPYDQAALLRRVREVLDG